MARERILHSITVLIENATNYSGGMADYMYIFKIHNIQYLTIANNGHIILYLQYMGLEHH